MLFIGPLRASLGQKNNIADTYEMYRFATNGNVPGIASKMFKHFTKNYSPTSVSELWIPAALAVSGHTREEHLKFDDPDIVMKSAKQFVESNNDGRSILVSDNNGFDAAWINAYMHKFAGGNPFGHSSRRIGDLYAGLRKNFRDQNGWKKHKTTKHTHNPVDDAMGNAEALLFICQKYGISI